MHYSVFELGWIFFTYFGIAEGTHVGNFRLVQATEDVSTGQLPQYSVDLMFSSDISCAFFATFSGGKLLAYQENTKRCIVYTQRGPVQMAGIDIFFGKVPGGDFIFSEEQNTWYNLFYCSSCFAVDAYLICENNNARAFYVNSAARQQFLETTLQGKIGFFLIDGSDYDRDNVFTHSNGALMTYFNYAANEPSRLPQGEDCLAVSSIDNFMWHDILCNDWTLLNGVICEIPP